MNKSIILGMGLVGVIASPVKAEVKIPDLIAQSQPIPINVTPGEVTSINFQNNEFITYVILSDSSRHVYTLNAPTESGAAKSIFLKRIKPLDFPGETTSPNPNLFVVTQNSMGNQKQYEFILGAKTGEETNITISPTSIPKTKPPLVIQTELGAATPKDIRTGLRLKFHQGQLDESDPLALAVAETLAIALNEDKTLISVAEELQVPLSFLSELGRIGLAENARHKLAGDSISHPRNLPFLGNEQKPSPQSTSSTREKKVLNNPSTSYQKYPTSLSQMRRELIAEKSTVVSRTSESKNNQQFPNQTISPHISTMNLGNQIKTKLGTATIDDVILGWNRLNQQKTWSKSQILAISQVLTEVAKGKATFNESAQAHDVSLALISEIGRIGLAFQTRERILGDGN